MTDIQTTIAILVGFALIGVIIHAIMEAVRNLTPAVAPECLMSSPGPRERAENGCHECDFAVLCLRVFAPNAYFDEIVWMPVPEGGYRYEPKHRLPELPAGWEIGDE